LFLGGVTFEFFDIECPVFVRIELVEKDNGCGVGFSSSVAL
jgi:hypothetical protein